MISPDRGYASKAYARVARETLDPARYCGQFAIEGAR